MPIRVLGLILVVSLVLVSTVPVFAAETISDCTEVVQDFVGVESAQFIQIKSLSTWAVLIDTPHGFITYRGDVGYVVGKPRTGTYTLKGSQYEGASHIYDLSYDDTAVTVSFVPETGQQLTYVFEPCYFSS